MNSPRTGRLLALLVIASALGSCSTSAPAPEPVSTVRPTGDVPSGLPKPLRDVLVEEHNFLTTGNDIVEVAICVVPLDTTSDEFEPSTLRIELDPAGVALTLATHVAPYFQELSDDRYHPRFVAGSTIQLRPGEGTEACLADAIAASAQTSTGVLAVATAENRAGSNGGHGTPGTPCPSDEAWPCPASITGRGAYVGASDFHPDWGAIPALDLIEHELGHMLGWPHSGARDSGYASSLDVMSNSAAPRDTDPRARNGQGTLAINRVAAGWMPLADVISLEQGTTTVALSPSESAQGTRIAVLPIDDDRFLTVEYLTPAGLQSHLPTAGITVTLVDLSECARIQCVLEGRIQETLVGAPPFVDVLGIDGTWTGWGWSVAVSGVPGATATVAITGAGGGLNE